MSVTFALPVGMKSFKKLLTAVSADVSVCVRGRHAIGKSEGVYQAAAELRSDLFKDSEYCSKVVKAFGGHIRLGDGSFTNEWSYEKGIPVMERRLSQLTEGDIIGLPILDDRSRSTQFKPCDWLITAVEFPCILFLDERNRAIEGVKQAVFQLTDSKVFYGYRLHPETRIVIAENVGDAYQVQQCDPAEVSRCATVELKPSYEEWIEWASNNCHEVTVEYLRQNPKHLEHEGPNWEANKKYPDRRAWVKLDKELARLGLLDDDDVDSQLLYVLAGSFVGVEIASAFQKYILERERTVKVDDILENWTKAKKRLSHRTKGISAESYVECVQKIGDWLKKNLLNDHQARELAKFMKDCPAEPCMAMWASLQSNVKNLVAVHPYIKQLMVRRASGRDISDLMEESPPSTTESNETATAAPPAPVPRKRGRR